MQYKQNKTAPCIKFGNESLAACIFQGSGCIFFRWLLWVSFGFLHIAWPNLCLACLSNFRYGAQARKGYPIIFREPWDRIFLGRVPTRHVLRTVSTWALLKNFPDIFGAHMAYKLLGRSGPDNNFWFSAVWFCHFFLFLLKITGRFPWEPQNTDRRSSLLPTHTQMLFLTHHSVPEHYSSVPPVSHLRYLKIIEQNCRVSLVGRDTRNHWVQALATHNTQNANPMSERVVQGFLEVQQLGATTTALGSLCHAHCPLLKNLFLTPRLTPQTQLHAGGAKRECQILPA